ncbi:MAG: divalent-cation tolerance protein CutA [Methanomethylovorans sp.]|uniref:divalent-cation tolerance protein CutA n=1 Tax=Methanomethylovorans sp. TaxID=2758717 RepID=UPI003C74CB76
MIIIVHTTTANLDEAKNIANVLVGDGLAACVNMRPVTSVYKWEDKIEEEGEIELSIKTTSEMLESVRNTILSMHSYELPALIWWPVDGYIKYVEWIAESVKK